jgi:hypothetical protein
LELSKHRIFYISDLPDMPHRRQCSALDSS